MGVCESESGGTGEDSHGVSHGLAVAHLDLRAQVLHSQDAADVMLVQFSLTGEGVQVDAGVLVVDLFGDSVDAGGVVGGHLLHDCLSLRVVVLGSSLDLMKEIYHRHGAGVKSSGQDYFIIFQRGHGIWYMPHFLHPSV